MIVALVLPVGFALYGIFDGITLNYTVEISSIQASSLPALNGATTSLTPSFNLTVRVYNHFRHHICFTNWEASVFYDGIPLGRGSFLDDLCAEGVATRVATTTMSSELVGLTEKVQARLGEKLDLLPYWGESSS